jgi:hypothetical protein
MSECGCFFNLKSCHGYVGNSIEYTINRREKLWKSIIFNLVKPILSLVNLAKTSVPKLNVKGMAIF